MTDSTSSRARASAAPNTIYEGPDRLYVSADLQRSHGSRMDPLEVPDQSGSENGCRNEPEPEGSQIVGEPYGPGAANCGRGKRDRGDAERYLSRHVDLSLSCELSLRDRRMPIV